MRNHYLDQLAQQMNQRWEKHHKRFRKNIRDLVYEIISLAPEAAELRDDGTLAYQLGLVRGTGNSIVDKIAKRVADSMLIRFRRIRRRGKNIVGGIRFGVIKSSYDDVLSLDEAKYVTLKGVTIPWLEWLLLKGDGVIIQDYGFIKTRWEGSRSGGSGQTGGVMLPLKDDGLKIAWRITPSTLSGTQDDNWLTRAMESKANYFFGQIGEYIKAIF